MLPYADYVARLVAWCGGPEVCRVVADEHDRPVALPDSNCLIVLERR